MKTKLDVAKLLAEANEMTYWLDGSGAYMGMKPAAGIPLLPPLLTQAVQEIGVLERKRPLNVMLNRLPAGVTVPKHTDTVPGKPVRMHLPLATNEHCFFWDELNGERHFPLGEWSGPVLYHIEHNVWNHGTTERIHLVVDLR